MSGAPSSGLVFVVDDTPSLRESMGSLIRSAGHRVEIFASPREFLERPALREPSCLVLDIELDGENGLDLQDRLAADRSFIPIIVVTAYGDVERSVRALKAGAIEFLTKPFDDQVLLDSVAGALEKSRTLLQHGRELDTLNERYRKLTVRERQVMQLVISGKLNKEIAAALGTQEITVKIQRGRMMQKMGGLTA
jgi:FixJ family two-component response regulator